MSKLLVVDDEEEICEQLALTLGQAGCAVHTCANGTEAIEFFRRERADVVLCDLKLPGLDGLSVLEAMKGIDPWVTIIVMTGYSSVETATHALRLGAYDFVEKPFTAALVLQITHRALEHRRKLRELSLLQGRDGSAADVQARLVQLEQLRADFLHMVLRDLKAPLKELDRTVEMVERENSASEDALKQQALLQELNRTRSLLARLSLESFALFLSYEQRASIETVDVRALLANLLEKSRPRCQEAGLALQELLPQEPVVGMTDAEKVSWIALELLENALQFTPSGGKIACELTAEPGGFLLRVQDTGSGIGEQEKAWLFSSLQLPPNHRSQPQKKIGQGLALVKHYVDFLNGTIQAHSAPGQGSTFIVRLPWWDHPQPRQDRNGDNPP